MSHSFLDQIDVQWVALIQSVSNLPGSGVGHSVGAGSPFTDYTARVVSYVFLTGFLVSILLIGGILLLSLGLMSKRPEDQVGDRNPSDSGILKNTSWPPAPYEKRTLPAEEEEKKSA